MVRACLPCLLLLFMVASTISLYQGGYYPTAVRYPAPTALSYDGFYGRTSYPTNTYRPTTYSRTSYPATSYPTSSYVPAYSALIKNSYSTGSNIPLCKAGGEMLLKVFVEKDYKPVLNAKVSYVDNKGLKTVSTNQYGLASITANGCSVALMVYHKEDNPVYRTVDLFSCTTRTEKVVIKVDDKCNFNLHFSYEAITGSADDCLVCGDEHQLVYFIYNSAYDHTGYEEAVAKTACITAGEQGETLKVIVESQYGNTFNVLNINIGHNRNAVMALPPQLPTSEKIYILITSNTWEHHSHPYLNKMAWTLIAQTGFIIDPSSPDTQTYAFSAAVNENILADDRWLLAVRYITSLGPDADNDGGEEVNLEGSVVVSDCDGNYQTVEHPNAGADYIQEDWFVVGCFCNNAPSMKVGDFFPVGLYDTTATPSFSTYCDDKCNT